MSEEKRRLEARLAEGQALASTLVGLSQAEAVERLRAAGFHPQIIPPTHTALTMDLRFERVRVWVDGDDQVIRAHAG
jgi:hypothetical protein